MTDTTTMRVYTREANGLEQTVTVNIDPAGYIRMRADNLDSVLRQLGFKDTKEPTT